MTGAAWPPQRFNFDTLGGKETASSRLRAWMLADQLNEQGYEATLNEGVAVDVQVFQKRVHFGRLREARGHGALVVLDLDDNVLLEGFGRKNRYLSFMNAADVVTVGSPRLVQIAGAYHDHVVLFDNPLDVPPGSGVKGVYEWQGRLGWFGNPAGLAALEDTGMRDVTVAVTRQGDIPWSLETIDETLRSFDLVLIPVRWDSWSEGKNAHRLLKCVALGVPFLASRTPEHERAVREMGLPDWLLVSDEEDWRQRAGVVERRYGELADALGPAARAAWGRHGGASLASRWLADLARVRGFTGPPLDLPAGTKAQLRSMDVLVLNENEPELATRTLASLRLDDVCFRSVQLVSALPMSGTAVPGATAANTAVLGAAGDDTPVPGAAAANTAVPGAPAVDLPVPGASAVDTEDRHDDFFQVYSSMATAASRCSGSTVLFIRAGVELTRGFFEELGRLGPARGVHLFALQRMSPDLTLAPNPPTRLDHLLERPYIPSLYLCPAHLLLAHGGFRPIFGPFASWDLLIGLAGDHGVPLAHVAAPVAWVDARTEGRTAMDSYRLHLERKDETALAGRVGAGWHRLHSVWHAAVVEAHRDVFGRYASTIVPRLALEYFRLEERATWDAGKGAGPFSLGAQWLDLLGDGVAAGVAEEPVRLVRTEEGGVYLIDRGRRREVASELLVNALERALGPATIATGADIAGRDTGPPVVVFADEFHEHFLVAGGKRYLVTGLLLPWQVTSGDLTRFERSDTVIEVTER